MFCTAPFTLTIFSPAQTSAKCMYRGCSVGTICLHNMLQTCRFDIVFRHIYIYRTTHIRTFVVIFGVVVVVVVLCMFAIHCRRHGLWLATGWQCLARNGWDGWLNLIYSWSFCLALVHVLTLGSNAFICGIALNRTCATNLSVGWVGYFWMDFFDVEKNVIDCDELWL